MKNTDKDSERRAGIRIKPGEGVRYTVPETIDPVRMEEKLPLRFRVDRVYENCYVSIYFENRRIFHKKRRVAAPGEMEEVGLERKELLKYPHLKEITVRIEEE